MIDALQLAAPAKVNLWLRVLRRRPDGYHELDTLFQMIDLADVVRVERAARGVTLEVEGADLGPPEENLAFRAAARALRELGLGGGLHVRLHKRIPAGAGLGGGSSDAAAVLRCAARLAGAAAHDARLFRVAAELGSDVPFFLGATPLARGRGRGDELEPLEPLPAADLVVVSPPVHASTAWAYGALAEERRARDAAADPVDEDDESEADATGAPAGMMDAARPASWADVARLAHNDFEPLVARAHPEVAASLEALRGAGARPALVAGSGSSAFGVFRDRERAEHAAARLRARLGWPCVAARTLVRVPEPGRP